MTARQFSKVALVAALAMTLASCSAYDTVSGWFSGGGSKVKLKGERISVMVNDESLAPDPDLASVNVVLPAPYANDAWPNPGGFADNAMYHLEAKGPLQQLWAQDAGKGSDTDSRLTAPPVVAGGKVFVLDSKAHVYAVDANSGEQLWDDNLAPHGESSFWHDYSLGIFGQDNPSTRPRASAAASPSTTASCS